MNERIKELTEQAGIKLEKFAALVEAAARADEREDLVRTLDKAEAHIKFLEDEIRARGTT